MASRSAAGSAPGRDRYIEGWEATLSRAALTVVAGRGRLAPMVPTVLTIAGSDPSGGAGLQADLKTFHRHGVYGTGVVTLLTVQNTTAVRRVELVDAELVAQQLDAVLADIPPGAAKTGALGSASVVQLVAERFADRGVPLVVDPVRIATHGAPLLDDEARALLLERLLPVAALVTPNVAEAQWLSGVEIHDEHDAGKAAKRLIETGVGAVLIKGGHLEGDEAVDVLCTGRSVERLATPRVGDRPLHGLGCALSAAIAARLARDEDLLSACTLAKWWLSAAIASAPRLGAGNGPIDHLTPPPDEH